VNSRSASRSRSGSSIALCRRASQAQCGKPEPSRSYGVLRCMSNQAMIRFM
jgi:hypothetical protein